MCGLTPRLFGSKRLHAYRVRYFSLDSKTTVGSDVVDEKKSLQQQLSFQRPPSQTPSWQSCQTQPSRQPSQSQPQPRPLRTAPETKSRSSLPRALRFGRECPSSSSSSPPLIVKSHHNGRNMGFCHSTMATDQYLRLVLGLLPFTTIEQFDDWLASDAVAGSWWEFIDDYYRENANSPDPDKKSTARLATFALQSKAFQTKYLVYHPSKVDWTSQDHHARFIAVVIHDSMLNHIWLTSDLTTKIVAITEAVYEVLSYLKYLSSQCDLTRRGRDSDTFTRESAEPSIRTATAVPVSRARSYRVHQQPPPQYSESNRNIPDEN